MNATDRRSLAPILSHLRPGFSGEEYDNFINYAHTSTEHTLRVVRFVGPARCMVVFHYGELPSHKWSTNYRHTQKLSFVHETGVLVTFDSKAVEAAWKAMNPNKSCNWERVIGDYIMEQGARAYKGANWAGRIASDLVTILNEWVQYHNLPE